MRKADVIEQRIEDHKAMASSLRGTIKLCREAARVAEVRLEAVEKTITDLAMQRGIAPAKGK